MAPQTETRTGAGFTAGVKDYRLTYYTPDYQVEDTDILAAFRMTPQPGVPPEECGAAVAAESSTEHGQLYGLMVLLHLIHTRVVVMISNQLLVKITNTLLM